MFRQQRLQQSRRAAGPAAVRTLSNNNNGPTTNKFLGTTPPPLPAAPPATALAQGQLLKSALLIDVECCGFGYDIWYQNASNNVARPGSGPGLGLGAGPVHVPVASQWQQQQHQHQHLDWNFGKRNCWHFVVGQVSFGIGQRGGSAGPGGARC